MSEHPALTERQREVIVATVESGGHIKGAAAQLGISRSGAYARVNYALVRCGCCNSIVELVFHHHHELVDGVTSPTTATERAG